MFVRKRFSLFGGVAAALLIAYTAVLPASQVFAQTAPVRPPLNLMSSPLPLNVVTTPGKAVTADIRVKNNGGQPEVLKVELLKFGAESDSGQPKLMDREPTDRYFDWVTFSETNFTAEPNVWKTIKMTINPPKEAAFGYYYAVVFSRSNPQKPTGGASGVEGGLASLVLLNVEAPGARRSAEVAELVATQKVYEFLPANFTVKLRNKGNVHVSPVGTLFIKRGGTQVATIGFNQQLGNILPGTNRTFDVDWKEGFPSYVTTGTGEAATRELKWDFGNIQNLRFGRYTATLVAVYDDGTKDIPIEAEVSFWVIPWRILGVILLIVLLVGGGMWAIFRTIWRGVRKQIVRVPAAAPAGTPSAGTPAAPPEPLPELVEEEPEENSLAAYLKRKKEKREDKKQDKKKQAEQKAADKATLQEAAAQPPAPETVVAAAAAIEQPASDSQLSKKQRKKQKQAAAAAARQEAQRKLAEEAAEREAKRKAEEAEREAKRKAEAAEREEKRRAEEAERKAAEEARKAVEEAEREAKRQAAAEAARKAEAARIAAEEAAAEAARLAEQAGQISASNTTARPNRPKPSPQPQSPHKKKPKKNKHQNRHKRDRRS